MRNEIIPDPIECSTADEFLGALSPVGQYFLGSKLPAQWLFRGQGRDYELVPGEFRDDGKFASLTTHEINNYGQRLLAERDILIQFFEIADRRGLVLPDDSQELRATLETV